MERLGKDAISRASRVLLADKTNKDLDFVNVIRNEVAEVLEDYLDICSEIEVKIHVDEVGKYQIRIQCAADKIRTVKSI